MNPTLPHVPPNIVTLQCITRTTIVTENPVLNGSQNGNMGNLKPTGKHQGSLLKNPSDEQLRKQFQSSSGPPKKRLSPKRNSKSTGGKNDENLQPIEKSNNTDPPAAPTSHKPKPRPSQPFEKELRGKNLSSIRKFAPPNKKIQDPHDLVNAAIYPSHPSGSYYKQGDGDIQKHIGLKVQFVEDVPRSKKRKYSYQFGHISPIHSPANWQNLVTLTPRYHSRSTVHNQSTPFTPTRHFVPYHHVGQDCYQTPESWMRNLMTGPLIRTPQSIYHQAYGQQSFSNQVSEKCVTRSLTRSATKVRFEQPVASTSVTTRSAKKAKNVLVLFVVVATGTA